MIFGEIVPARWNRRSRDLRRSNDGFNDIQRHLSNMLDSFLVANPLSGLSPLFDDNSKTFNPRIDVKETETAIEVKAELPGLTQDQVTLTLNDDALILRGEKSEEREDKDDKKVRYYAERHYGAFERIIPLNGEVETDKVDASFKNGVLTIVLPKSVKTQNKNRTVSIRAEK